MKISYYIQDMSVKDFYAFVRGKWYAIKEYDLFLMEGDHLKAHLVSPDWTQSKWNEVD
jgi:hypothetical protein